MDIFEAILWLSLVVYHESRCQEKLDQIAVAHVVLNRSSQNRISIKEVVLKPYQFSWTHQLDDYFPYDLKAFSEAAHSAYVAAQGHDFTGGATFYHRVDVKPKWRKKMVYLGRFGKHKFYKKRD